MKFPDIEEITHKYGKHDLERLGLFIEMPYMRAKLRKVPKRKKGAPLGPKNPLAGGFKTRCANADGYFEEFKRIFIKEAIKDRYKKRRDTKTKPTSKPPLKPTGSSKLHSTPGDHYGCFGGIVPAFSGKPRDKPPRQKAKKNFLTTPAHKGGPGYVDICLNKYPDHMADRYGRKLIEPTFKKKKPFCNSLYPRDYFEKNIFFEKVAKKQPIYVRPADPPPSKVNQGPFKIPGPPKSQGGCHAGCFERYPIHKSDRIRHKKPVKKEPTPVFFPSMSALKTLQFRSIVQRNIDFRMNTQNYKNFPATYLKYTRLN